MTIADPLDFSDAEVEASERLAQLLGDPLPADWRKPHAISARQNHLAAVAAISAEAALECVLACAERKHRGEPFDNSAPTVERLIAEQLALFRAWQRYRHDTQRDDARQIVVDAWTDSAGAVVATFMDNAFFGRFIPSLDGDLLLRAQHSLRHPLLGDLGAHLTALHDALNAEGVKVQSAADAVRQSIASAIRRGADTATVQVALDLWSQAVGGPQITVASALDNTSR